MKDGDYFHNENFDDFKTVEEVVANMFSIVKKTKYIAGEYKRITKNAAGVDNEELWFDKNRKMVNIELHKYNKVVLIRKETGKVTIFDFISGVHVDRISQVWIRNIEKDITKYGV